MAAQVAEATAEPETTGLLAAVKALITRMLTGPSSPSEVKMEPETETDIVDVPTEAAASAGAEVAPVGGRGGRKLLRWRHWGWHRHWHHRGWWRRRSLLHYGDGGCGKLIYRARNGTMESRVGTGRCRLACLLHDFIATCIQDLYDRSLELAAVIYT